MKSFNVLVIGSYELSIDAYKQILNKNKRVNSVFLSYTYDDGMGILKTKNINLLILTEFSIKDKWGENIDILKFINDIKEKYKDLKILISTLELNLGVSRRLMIENDIVSFVKRGKNESKEIEKAIYAISENNQYFSLDFQALLRRYNEITDRDIQILTLMSQGKTQKRVAEKVSISVSSIQKTLERLKMFFDAKSTVHLIAIAKDFGFMDVNIADKTPKRYTKIENNDIFKDENIDDSAQKTISGEIIATIDRDVKPILDVKVVASQFSKLIANLNDNTGQMLGVFGSWGRGKTFFVEQVCKELNIDFREEKWGLESNFYFMKFHAWKYQDTEGAWAYLYESISKKYYSHKDKLSWSLPKKYWLSRFWYKNISIPILKWYNDICLLYRLHLIRNGNTEVIWFFVSFVFASILTFLGTQFWYQELVEGVFNKMISLIINYGIVWGILLIVRLWKLGNKGSRIVDKYTRKVTFNSLLGIQSEIQDELVFLLKAWIKEDSNKRLLLFVDDIDRCQEERMIQVVDSLRVMLENEEIARRVVVVSAIDEIILERAIQWKYKDIINSNNSIEDKENQKIDSPKSLVKEYMDKLFIGGIKLAELKQDEREKILENYAENAQILEPISDISNSMNLDDGIDNEPEQIEEVQSYKEGDDEAYIEEGREKEEEVDNEELEEKEKFILTQSELQLLKTQSKELKFATPRQLRILMYRYLLAKSIAENYSPSDLSIEWSEWIIKEIISKTNDIGHKVDITRTKNESSEKINDQLIAFMPKLVEIVVPY